MREVNVVIWSGGMDSTLVLDRVCSSNPDKCIWAHTINWDMLNELKVKKEKEARKNYLRYAKAKGYDIAHRTITVTANMGAPDLGLAQCLAWFSYVIPYLPKKSRLYLGYHSADDFWKQVDEVDNYVRAATVIGNRDVTLEYPLQYMGKCGILEEFKSRRIPMSCFWTCENPKRKSKKIVSCGKCTPCIRLKTAKYESKLRKTFK
jgi:7-cyano-7-deazaguanine synthase in queuosine biosynthesis